MRVQQEACRRGHRSLVNRRFGGSRCGGIEGWRQYGTRLGIRGGMLTPCSGSTDIGIMGGKEGIGGATSISECRKGASTMPQMRGVD